VVNKPELQKKENRDAEDIIPAERKTMEIVMWMLSRRAQAAAFEASSLYLLLLSNQPKDCYERL